MKKSFYSALIALALLTVSSFGFAREHPHKSESVVGGKVTVLYKIGRWDSAHVFHGTDYDDTYYLTKKDCQAGYVDAVELVRKDAADHGGSKALQDRYVAAFKKLYSCLEVIVDPSPDAEPEPDPVQTTKASYVAVAEQTPNLAKFLPANPVLKKYFMAEFMQTPGYKPYWVTYEWVYASPVECHRARRKMIQQELRKLEGDFAKSSKDQYATASFQAKMQAFESRNRRLSCVVDGQPF